MGWNSKGRSGQGRTGARVLIAIVCLAALGLAACGLLPFRGDDETLEARPEAESVHSETVDQDAASSRFDAPGEIDQLADARPIALPPVKRLGADPAAKGQSESAGKVPAEPAGKGRFRIQVGAESDFDAAQEKMREYERKLGGKVDVIFDAPYYKLRWGFFETRQDAEDKILELGEFNIQGFVVKQ